MNKGALVRVIVWSVAALVLTAALVLSIIFVGAKGNILNLSGLNFSIGTGGTTYPDSESYTVGGASLTDSIDTLCINWRSGNVKIEAYDGDSIEISESPETEDDDAMRYLVSGSKLTIQYRKSGFFFGIEASPSKKLTVRLPEKIAAELHEVTMNTVSASSDISDISLQSLTVDSVSGALSLKNIAADNCSINTVSGDITAEKLTVKSLDTDTVSGGLNAEGSISKLDSNSTSGRVTLINDVMPEKIDFDTVSGDVRLTLPEEGGFTAEHDSISGDFNSDFALTNKGDKHIFGDGSSKFEFDSTSGDVTINKK